MIPDLDQTFHLRADAVIALANAQLDAATPAQVSASCMYATARFNAWVSARGAASGAGLAAARAGTIDYFVEQYRVMLEENLDWYIAQHPSQDG